MRSHLSPTRGITAHIRCRAPGAISTITPKITDSAPAKISHQFVVGFLPELDRANDLENAMRNRPAADEEDQDQRTRARSLISNSDGMFQVRA